MHLAQCRTISFLMVAVVAILIAFGLSAGAQFTGDDWHFLVLLRNIDSPWDALTSNVGGSYYYRPFVLVLFWLTTVAFGVDPLPHYVLNVALHCWVAFEVFAFVRGLTNKHACAAWAGLLFLVLPLTAATPLWISDRFDLVATGAMLLSLRLMTRWAAASDANHWPLYGAAVAGLLAYGSKETAFALLPAQLMLIALFRARAMAARRMAAVAVALSCGAALACRYFALDGWTGRVSPPMNFDTMFSGVTRWFQSLPTALQTHDGGIVLCVLGTLAICSFMFRQRVYRISAPTTLPTVNILTTLLIAVLGAVAAQSSVAAIILPHDGAPLATATLRLFYTPSAFAFIGVGVFVSRIGFLGIYRHLASAVGLSAVLFCAAGSAAQTHSWVAASLLQAIQALPAVREYAQKASEALASSAPCTVHLSAQSTPHTDIDLRFKATLSPTDPRLNCVVVTVPPQVNQITRISECAMSSVAPLRSAITDLQPMVRSGTCTFFFLID